MGAIIAKLSCRTEYASRLVNPCNVCYHQGRVKTQLKRTCCLLVRHRRVVAVHQGPCMRPSTTHPLPCLPWPMHSCRPSAGAAAVPHAAWGPHAACADTGWACWCPACCRCCCRRTLWPEAAEAAEAALLLLVLLLWEAGAAVRRLHEGPWGQAASLLVLVLRLLPGWLLLLLLWLRVRPLVLVGRGLLLRPVWRGLLLCRQV